MPDCDCRYCGGNSMEGCYGTCPENARLRKAAEDAKRMPEPDENTYIVATDTPVLHSPPKIVWVNGIAYKEVWEAGYIIDTSGDRMYAHTVRLEELSQVKRWVG